MAGPTYTFLTLDSGGSAGFNELLGINDQGEVVGYFGSGVSPDAFPTAIELPPPYGAPQYVVLSGGSSTVYSAPGASTIADAISNSGTVVGIASTSPGAAYQSVSFGPSSSPALTPNGVAGLSGPLSSVQVLGINDAGVEVGFKISGGGHQAVMLASAQSTVVSPLGTLSAPSTAGGPAFTITPSEATGINDANVIVGITTVSGGTDGFIYDAVTGSVTTLTGPNGGTFTEALGLNNQGQVVGVYAASLGAATHGFVYTMASTVAGAAVAASYVSIDATYTSPGSTVAATATETVVNGINDLGQIVGYYKSGDLATHGLLAYVPGSETNITNPVAGSTIDVGLSQSLVALGGSNAVTLVDPGVGQVTLFANAGADTIDAYGASDTIVGGSGGNTIAATGSGDAIYLGGGANSLVAAAAATIVGAGSADRIFAYGGGVVFAGKGDTSVLGAGAGTVASTIVGGSGSLVANAGAVAGAVVFAGSGDATIVGGSAQSTLVGGSGSATIFAGSGGGQIFGGSGTGFYVASNSAGAATTEMVVGQGASTVIANAGTVLFLTGSSNAFVADLATGSSANETLVANGSSGNDTFQLGTGNDLVFAGAGTTDLVFGGKGADTIVGGSGTDTYTFVKGVSGGAGASTVYGFKQGTDLLSLNGYGATEAKSDLGNATFAGGNTKLSLTDGTRITFVGVHLTASAFG